MTAKTGIMSSNDHAMLIPFLFKTKEIEQKMSTQWPC